MDWNAVAETYRNGPPAWAAIALARCVLPVPGGPSKSRPRRGVPPISRRNVRPPRNRSRERRTSSRTTSIPTTSAIRTSICSARNTTWGDRPDASVVPSRTAMSRTKKAPDSRYSGSTPGRDTVGRPAPAANRTSSHAMTTATTASTEPNRRRRRRSRAAATSIPGSLPIPPSPDVTVSLLRALVCPSPSPQPACGGRRRAAERPPRQPPEEADPPGERKRVADRDRSVTSLRAGEEICLAAVGVPGSCGASLDEPVELDADDGLACAVTDEHGVPLDGDLG